MSEKALSIDVPISTELSTAISKHLQPHEKLLWTKFLAYCSSNVAPIIGWHYAALATYVLIKRKPIVDLMTDMLGPQTLETLQEVRQHVQDLTEYFNWFKENHFHLEIIVFTQPGGCVTEVVKLDSPKTGAEIYRLLGTTATLPPLGATQKYYPGQRLTLDILVDVDELITRDISLLVQTIPILKNLKQPLIEMLQSFLKEAKLGLTAPRIWYTKVLLPLVKFIYLNWGSDHNFLAFLIQVCYPGCSIDLSVGNKGDQETDALFNYIHDHWRSVVQRGKSRYLLSDVYDQLSGIELVDQFGETLVIPENEEGIPVHKYYFLQLQLTPKGIEKEKKRENFLTSILN
jgi:hypothetical protein